METGGAIVINLFPEGCRHKAKPDGPTPFFFPPLLLPLPHEVEIRAAFAPNQWLWLFLSGGWLSPFGTLPRPVMWRRGSLGGHKKRKMNIASPPKICGFAQPQRHHVRGEPRRSLFLAKGAK